MARKKKQQTITNDIEIIKRCHLTMTSGIHNKFYEIELCRDKNSMIFVRTYHGRINKTKIERIIKNATWPERIYENLKKSKLDKGYQDVSLVSKIDPSRPVKDKAIKIIISSRFKKI